MKHLFKFASFLFVLTFFASCTSINKTMKEPNVRVELNRNDFTISEQFSAEATSVKIFGIDFKRLFKSTAGASEGASASINLASLPIIGNYLGDKTANYALYEIMNGNQGYDVVIYPQYETRVSKPFLGLGFILKKTTVKATARLGKLK
jgi:hypothetical protein